jgi:hypothetical protein
MLSALGMKVTPLPPLEPPGVVFPVGVGVGFGFGFGFGTGSCGIDGGEGNTFPLGPPGVVLPPSLVNCKDANKNGTRLKVKMRLLGFNMMII